MTENSHLWMSTAALERSTHEAAILALEKKIASKKATLVGQNLT